MANLKHWDSISMLNYQWKDPRVILKATSTLYSTIWTVIPSVPAIKMNEILWNFPPFLIFCYVNFKHLDQN